LSQHIPKIAVIIHSEIVILAKGPAADKYQRKPVESTWKAS